MRLSSCLLGALLVAAPSAVLAQTTTATTTTAPTKPMMSAPASGPGKSAAVPSSSAAASSGSPTHYASESDATSKCSGDTVVWANATSKALHLSGDRYFGKSKHGFFTCEKDAMADGFHMAGHRHKHAAKSA